MPSWKRSYEDGSDKTHKAHNTHYLSAPGPEDHTEVYVVPLTDWLTWVQRENEIPGTGMEIEKDTSFLMEYHM